MKFMTTTTRSPKKKTAPKGDIRTETLAQFSASLDEIAQRDVGFMKAVTGLYVARAQLAQIKAARAAVWAHVRAAYDIGHRAIHDTPYDLRETEPGAATTYRAAASAVVKKTDPAAWRRAHVVVPFVQIKAPESIVAVPELELPTVSGFVAPAAAVTLHKEHPAWAQGKKLADSERWLITKLEDIGAEFDWPGDLKVFADGWSAQLTREQFSSDRLAEVDPALFDQLSEWKTRQAAPRLYIARRDAADGEAELDEFDGD